MYIPKSAKILIALIIFCLVLLFCVSLVLLVEVTRAAAFLLIFAG